MRAVVFVFTDESWSSTSGCRHACLACVPLSQAGAESALPDMLRCKHTALGRLQAEQGSLGHS